MRLLSDSVQLRVIPSSRATLGVGIAAVLAAIVMTVWLLSGRPHAASVAAVGTPVSSSARSPSVAPRPVAASTVVVDVVGKVRRPGVYRLVTGSRVQDAVRAAGGALPGVADASVNLAARLADGEQVAIGVLGAAPPDGGPATGTATTANAAGGPVDLNSASEQQLESLPGVGPVLAQHVLAWRAAHGGFASVQQLDDVPGVGAAKFAELKSLVTV